MNLIGDYLIKEGFVAIEDISEAMDIQRSEMQGVDAPLHAFIHVLKPLDDQVIERIFGTLDLETDVGQFAVQNGWLSKEQLSVCVSDKDQQQSIGSTLMECGYLNNERILEALWQVVGVTKFIDFAVTYGLINREEVDPILNRYAAPRSIGEILCDMGRISPADLNYVLKKYDKHLKIGELLVKKKLIDSKSLTEALHDQGLSNEPLGKILIQKRLITKDQLYTVLSSQFNIPYEKLEDFHIDEKLKRRLINYVGQRYAEKNMVIPIKIDGSHLTLGISDPRHLQAAEDLRRVYGNLKISIVFIGTEKFNELFEVLYGTGVLRGTIGRMIDKPDGRFDDIAINLGEDADRGEAISSMYGISRMEAIELVNFLIKYGVKNKASDIHIEQDRMGPRVRFRIDGVLHSFNLPWFEEKLHENLSAIITRIKVISNLDITERRVPQDGVFRGSYLDPEKKEKFDIDFRVATCPAIVGENITIRILDSRNASVGLENLGHSPHVLTPLKELARSSAGMILISGPTGSGKTSTLYGLLQHIYSPGLKIITAEDPIEYSLSGVMQTQVNSKIDLTFARLLRSFLRLDPDVILVGEVRDFETANIAFDAAQTGHLVLSTVHTNDSFSTILRLIDLGIDRFRIAAGLMATLSQRLARRICPSCKTEYMPHKREWEFLFDHYPSDFKFFRGGRCKECDNTGYKGRMLLSEIFVLNTELSIAINQGADEKKIKQLAFQQGIKTMVDDGLMKIAHTTLSELLRVIPHEIVSDYRMRHS